METLHNSLLPRYGNCIQLAYVHAIPNAQMPKWISYIMILLKKQVSQTLHLYNRVSLILTIETSYIDYVLSQHQSSLFSFFSFFFSTQQRTPFEGHKIKPWHSALSFQFKMNSHAINRNMFSGVPIVWYGVVFLILINWILFMYVHWGCYDSDRYGYLIVIMFP